MAAAPGVLAQRFLDFARMGGVAVAEAADQIANGFCHAPQHGRVIALNLFGAGKGRCLAGRRAVKQRVHPVCIGSRAHPICPKT